MSEILKNEISPLRTVREGTSVEMTLGKFMAGGGGKEGNSWIAPTGFGVVILLGGNGDYE